MQQIFHEPERKNQDFHYEEIKMQVQAEKKKKKKDKNPGQSHTECLPQVTL